MFLPSLLVETIVAPLALILLNSEALKQHDRREQFDSIVDNIHLIVQVIWISCTEIYALSSTIVAKLQKSGDQKIVGLNTETYAYAIQRRTQ